MRDENEMLDLILGFAEADERILAVILNGSRVNPMARPDVFQDFDIVWFVTDVTSFILDRKWQKKFGDVMILQTPDLMQVPVPDQFTSFAFLMQFMDGNRIDLTLFDVSKINEFKHDSLTKALCDKDGFLPSFPEPDESDYLLIRPTAQDFHDCCNEFWWITTYVAKGLWRRQMVYYKHMQEQVSRNQLIKMISWYIGTKTDFRCNLGAYGKNITAYLEPDVLAMLQDTYSGAGPDESWDALFVMCDVFRFTGKRVASYMKFQYPAREDKRVTAHLRHVRNLPEKAGPAYPPAAT